ncbi:MAG: serine--tRNA ligase [Candidatus Eremiobacteraeota bacterium]|nr:serine--tRNA ligase [Candidatus Eremiobacteraeota bacterium]
MLDLKFILKNPDLVAENSEKRNMPVSIDRVIALAAERSQKLQLLEEKRQAQNEIARKMKGPLADEERKSLVSEGAQLKSTVAELEKELKDIEPALRDEQARIPNLTHPEAPVGKGEHDNRELRKSGHVPEFSFTPRDHGELGKMLDILDFDNGTKVSGPKFYFLKGAGALLEIALVNYALQTLIREGFTPYITPDLAKSSVLFGTGFNPRGEETQIYSVAGSDLCLIATSEITLAGLLSDTILAEKDLPLRLAGYSHCFRTEAGTYGRASKGLYRVHQFTKVEMFAYTVPEESDAMLEQLVGIEEKIFTGLGIPYRVVECCTGDLGAAAYRKYDIEAWMPGREEGGTWGEVTSASNCSDYQARRLNIRYRPKGGKGAAHIHTLNGTAIAVSRALIAIMENYQRSDGSVAVPEVLRPMVGKDELCPP